MADLMSAGPNGPCPYPGELSVTPAQTPCATQANGGFEVHAMTYQGEGLLCHLKSSHGVSDES